MDEINISELSLEQLRELEASLVQEGQELRDSETRDMGTVEALSRVADRLDAVRTELVRREELEARFNSLADRVQPRTTPAATVIETTATEEAAGGPQPDDEPDEPDEPEERPDEVVMPTPPQPVEQPESQQEAALPARRVTPAGMRAPASHAPMVPSAPSRAPILAGADIPGFSAGQELPSLEDAARALLARHGVLRSASPSGDGEYITVGTLAATTTEDRILTEDIGPNMQKIANVVNATREGALVAAGWCAPCTPMYTQPVMGDTVRPVRDALASFLAPRGSVCYVPPPCLDDLPGTWSNRYASTTDFAAAPKGCGVVTCRPSQTVALDVLTRCIIFDNLMARAFPEQVAAWLALSLVEYARKAENSLLAALKTGSTAVTVTPWYSATRTVLGTLDLAMAGYQSRWRLATKQRMRLLLPFWARDLIRQDLAAQAPGDGLEHFAVSDAQIDSWFAARNTTVTWYLDGASPGPVATFGAQGAGALIGWPGGTLGGGKIPAYLFADGTWFFLDGGSIDFGIVRDSVLNPKNQYQIFTEGFENVFFFGCESLYMEIPACPNGAGAASTTAEDCAP